MNNVICRHYDALRVATLGDVKIGDVKTLRP
jgi:hypothetical protein